MSRPQGTQAPSETLPPTARAIALLLASTPTVQDAQPGVLHQLLEFAHRYTTQVLSDAQVYAEHAGRSGASKIEMEDIVLAVQARVGWEFGGRVPKEVCPPRGIPSHFDSPLTRLVLPHLGGRFLVSDVPCIANERDASSCRPRGLWCPVTIVLGNVDVCQL